MSIVQRFPVGVSVLPPLRKGLQGNQPIAPNYGHDNRNPIFFYTSQYGSNEKIDKARGVNSNMFTNLDTNWRKYCLNSISEPIITASAKNKMYEWTSIRTGKTTYVAFSDTTNKNFTIKFHLINYTKYGYRPAENMIYFLGRLFDTKIIEIENDYINIILSTKFIAIHEWRAETNSNPNAIPFTLRASTQFQDELQ